MNLKESARDVCAELLYSAGITVPRNLARLTIVTFHRVLSSRELSEYPLPGLAVTTEEFEWFLRFFGRHFECTTLESAHERWLQQRSSERPLLAVTFDDGQLDNFANARDVLARVGVRATFFPTSQGAENGRLLWHDRAAYAFTAWFDKDEPSARKAALALGVRDAKSKNALVSAVLSGLKRLTPEARARFIADLEERFPAAAPSWDGMMSFEHLRTLVRDGHEVGSHSRSHALLTQLADDELYEELESSKNLLEAKLQHSVTSICYPNGNADSRVARAGNRVGYRRGVTTAWGWNARGTDPLLLRRCDIQSATSRSGRGALSMPRVAWRVSGLHPFLD
jgi:peptidoglycan/xylan/chitin deacetylase (PgdA/CDA1 family)